MPTNLDIDPRLLEQAVRVMGSSRIDLNRIDVAASVPASAQCVKPG